MKRLLVALATLSLLLVGCAGQPLDEIYTQNVYPGTNGAYSIGGADNPYSAGYFVTVHADNVTVSDNLSLAYLALSGNFTAENVAASGVVVLSGLPMADPHVPGQLWSDNGTLKVSRG